MIFGKICRKEKELYQNKYDIEMNYYNEKKSLGVLILVIGKLFLK